MPKKLYSPTALSLREAPDHGCNYRTMSLRLDQGGTPVSLDDKSRSVDVVAASENPVAVYDYERWEVVNEVLLMSGCELPTTRQLPLLDTHYRGSTESVIGSCRALEITGDQLLGRAHFSNAPEGEAPFQKIREGHLTDFSIGYRVLEAQYVPEGEKQSINGRMFVGPVKVATRWQPKELSVCPIGADELAKARAEHNPPAPQKKEIAMDPKLRAFLERRGLAKDATEAEAESFLKELEGRMDTLDDGGQGRSTPQPGSTAEVDKIRAEATGAEQSRIREIDAMCRRFDCVDLADGMISKNTTVDAARKAILDHLAAKDEKGAGQIGHRAPAEVGVEDREKFRAAAGDALVIRAGLPNEKPAAGATDLVGYSLRELARECLKRSGQSDRGTAMDMVGRAMVSGDFPLLLANVANKSLDKGFDTAEETWNQWCDTGNASDFKTHNLVRASETDDLEEVPEHGEYKYGDRSEEQEQYILATFGKLFAITRQTIINDDLGAITDIPLAHGEAASRKIGDVVYAVFTANSAMGDGTALFHANHANLAGAGAVVGVTSIAAGIAAMKKQKDIRGKRRLNITPRFFIAPVSVEGPAEVFFSSQYFDGSNKAATTANPYSGTRFTRVYEPRLDDDSATAYYLAGPQGKTVTVFFLNGVQRPRMEVKQGWTVDGVEYKVSLDVAAKAKSWKGLYKNPGA